MVRDNGESKSMRMNTVGQFVRSIRRLHHPGRLLLRDASLRAPVHVWTGQGKRAVAAISRDRIRQMDWAHRQGARGAMLLTEAIDYIPVTDAIHGQEQPVGPLLQAIQGQADLDMAERQARRLGNSMRPRGQLSDTTVEDGVSAGLVALTVWRNQYTVHGGGDPSAGLVCWRAVQESMSEDTLGDRDSLASFDPDSLASSTLPLPQLVGDDSRDDKASRLLFERARARRPALLVRRVQSIKAQGGRGKRGELIERVGRACLH